MRHIYLTIIFIVMLVSTATTFVGDSKTMKFHIETCRTIKNMNDSNRVKIATKEQAVKSGYVPCKVCRP